MHSAGTRVSRAHQLRLRGRNDSEGYASSRLSCGMMNRGVRPAYRNRLMSREKRFPAGKSFAARQFVSGEAFGYDARGAEIIWMEEPSWPSQWDRRRRTLR